MSCAPNLDGDARRAVLVAIVTAAATTAATELVKWAHEELKQRVSPRERELERRIAALEAERKEAGST